MREGIALVAFTDRGLALAERLAAQLDGSVQNGRETGFSLGAWTAEQFARRAALIFARIEDLPTLGKPISPTSASIFSSSTTSRSSPFVPLLAKRGI